MMHIENYDIEADVEYFASGSLKHINPCWIRFHLYIAHLEREVEKRRAAGMAMEEAQRGGESSEGTDSE